MKPAFTNKTQEVGIAYLRHMWQGFLACSVKLSIKLKAAVAVQNNSKTEKKEKEKKEVHPQSGKGTMLIDNFKINVLLSSKMERCQ